MELITSDAIDALRATLGIKLNAQDFGEGDSMIASTLVNPGQALEKGIDWLRTQINTASGQAQPMGGDMEGYQQAPTQEQQAGAGLSLAGMAQMGSMPFAPKSSGGTLGSMISPGSRSDVPVGQVWKTGLDKTNQGRNIVEGTKTQLKALRDYVSGYKPEGLFVK